MYLGLGTANYKVKLRPRIHTDLHSRSALLGSVQSEQKSTYLT